MDTLAVLMPETFDRPNGKSSPGVDDAIGTL